MRRRLLSPIVGSAAPALMALVSACADQAPPLPPDPAPAAGPSAEGPAAALYEDLGRDEIRLADQALQQALERNPSGVPASWRSDARERGGTVTPLRTFRAAEGYFCREFTETVEAPAGRRSALRLACRTGDGRWLPARLDQPS